MTECPRGDMRDVLPDLLNDRLDAATRAEVARHVASCAECAAELELLRSLRSAMPAAPRVDAARIAAAVSAARAAPPDTSSVRPLSPRREPAPAHRRLAWRVAAAVVLAAAGLGTWAVVQRQPAPTYAVADSTPARPSAAAPAVPNVAATPPAAARPAVPNAAPVPHAAPQMLASTGRRGLDMDGGVSDLSDGQVKALLQSLDSLTAIPDADPAPMDYQIDDDGGLR